MTRSTGRSVAGAVATVVAVAGLVTGIARSEAPLAAQRSLGTGSAWFGSTRTGSVALIDGARGDRITHLARALTSANSEVVQDESSALVVDKDMGAVRRIDGATWQVSQPHEVSSRNDPELSVHTGGGTAWVIGQRSTVIHEIDPRALTPRGGFRTVPDRLSGTAVADDGTLWVTTPDGEVRSYRRSGEPRPDDRAVTTARVEGVGNATLVMAGGRTPIVFDPRQRIVQSIDPRSGEPDQRQSLDLPADSRPLIAGATSRHPWLLLVLPVQGVLIVADTRQGGNVPIPFGDVSPRPRYGEPVEKDGIVYVPDHQTGEIVVIDPLAPPARQIRRRVQTDLANGRLRLLVHSGRVWFDDPDGDDVGVITDDLVVLRASKDRGDGPGRAPAGPDRGPGDQRGPGRGPDATPGDGGGRGPGNGNAGGNGGPPPGQGGPANPPPPGSPVGGVNPGAPGGGPTVTTKPWPFPPPPHQGPDHGPPVTGSTTSTTPANQVSSTTTTRPRDVVAPDFIAQPPTARINQPVTVVDATTGPHGNLRWTFEGGTPPSATGDHPTVSWTRPSGPGGYRVTLVMDTPTSDTPTKTLTHTIVIDDNPAVPDVRGMTRDAAIAAVRAAGFTAGMVVPVASSVPRDQAIGSSPAAGTRLPPGATVTIQISSGPQVLSLTNAGDYERIGVYTNSQSVTADDTTGDVPLPRTTGRGFLQSRNFDGEPGTAAAGLDGFDYRLALDGLQGSGAPCVSAMSLPVPAAPRAFNFSGDGTNDQIYVVTSGGVGTVRVTRAEFADGRITFTFERPVCAGESSYFFGFAAAGNPVPTTATLMLTSGATLAVPARTTP